MMQAYGRVQGALGSGCLPSTTPANAKSRMVDWDRKAAEVLIYSGSGNRWDVWPKED